MGLLGDLTNVGFDSVQANILATAISGSGVGATWGNIGGTLSNQTDLQNALNAKQNTLPLGTIDTTNWNIIGNNTVGSVTASAFYFDSNSLYAKNIIPSAGMSYDLGSTNSYWRYVYSIVNYLSQYCRLQTASAGETFELYWYDSNASKYGTLQLVADCVRVIYGGQGGQVDLGSSYFPWKNIYANNTVNCLQTKYGEYTYIDSAAAGNVLQLHGRDAGTSKTVTLQLSGISFGPLPSEQISLGDQYRRWTTVYATNGTINVSDEREKSNIEPLGDALDKLNSIEIKSFTYNKINNCISYGFIAQNEVDKNPELVFVPEDSNKEDEKGVLGVYTNNVLYLAVKAIQELSDKVTNLEQKLKTINGDNYGN